jgi:hypothetical protein
VIRKRRNVHYSKGDREGEKPITAHDAQVAYEKTYPPQGHLQQFPMFSEFSRIFEASKLLAATESKSNMTVFLARRQAVRNALRS